MPVSWCSFLNRKVLENFIAIICPADDAVLNAQILNLNPRFGKRVDTMLFMISVSSDKIKWIIVTV